MPSRAIEDRCDVIHLAGRRRLSPAVRDGTPALVPLGELSGRCGWAPFFAALERRGLTVREEEDGKVTISDGKTSP